MRIINRSSRHPTPKLRRILPFIKDHIDLPNDAVLSLSDHRGPRWITCGLAWHRNDGGPLVELYLSWGTAVYPRKSRHVKEVQAVQLQSWEEEVLLVLSHELKHLNQYEKGTFLRGQEHASEVDAESFARDLLMGYRVRQR